MRGSCLLSSQVQLKNASPRGIMRARSIVLHGRGLGGQSLPQAHSPNDMVNCMCNLPYRRSSGVLWGSRVVREVLGWIGGIQGEIEGVPGRFREVMGGP